MVSRQGIARCSTPRARPTCDFAAGDRRERPGLRRPTRSRPPSASRRGSLIHASNLYLSQPVQAAGRAPGWRSPSRRRSSSRNSGTEAVEAAHQVRAHASARAAGRTELVAFERAFHGRTMGALSLTWTAKYREPFEPLVPGVALPALGRPDSGGRARRRRPHRGGLRRAGAGRGRASARVPAFLQRACRAVPRSAGRCWCPRRSSAASAARASCSPTSTRASRPTSSPLAKPLGGGLPLGAVLLQEDLAGAHRARRPREHVRRQPGRGGGGAGRARPSPPARASSRRCGPRATLLRRRSWRRSRTLPGGDR